MNAAFCKSTAAQEINQFSRKGDQLDMEADISKGKRKTRAGS
jgi:hypothetical protein